MQHHELLELCCYLATGDVTYLASAPPAVQELACSFRSLERHEVTPMDAHPNDALMLEISRIGSPQRLARGGGIGETPFVPTVQEGTELYVALLKTSWTSNVPTPVSVRAAYSGQLLFSKYLAASITASSDGAASVLHRLQQSTNFSLPFVLDQCMFIATSFFEGRDFIAHQSEELRWQMIYRDHILTAVQYDVAEVSPLEFTGLTELLRPELSSLIADLLYWMMGLPLALGKSASLLAAASILIVLLQQLEGDQGHQSQCLSHVESAWPPEAYQFLRDVIQFHDNGGAQ